jgi:hypothetical protein
MLLVPTLLALATVAPSSPLLAAQRPPASVKCCLETSVDDMPPHLFCFNLHVVHRRPRRALLRARVACRLIGGRPLRRSAA